MSRVPACFVELSREVLEFEVKLDFTVFFIFIFLCFIVENISKYPRLVRQNYMMLSLVIALFCFQLLLRFYK